MNGKWWSIAVLVALAGLLLGVNSCGHSQQLVSIQVQPPIETIGSTTTPVLDDAGAQVRLRALGTYIHPPVTKDITSSVTWASNTPQMFTVDSTGLLTATGGSCGGTLISATANTNTSAGGISSSGAVVTGFMTANVVCPTSSGGGGAGSPVLTVTFGGTGSGSATDSAQAISCAAPTPCAFLITSGTLLTLTATPAGASVFGSWGGCDSANNVNPCTLTLTGNRTVTATFN